VPHLTVASERSEKEIKEQQAAEEIEFALVELTANLMRVVRGAGAPHRIVAQLNACAAAFRAYFDDVGHMPSASLLATLIRMPGADRTLEGDRYEEALVNHSVYRAVLQIVASSLMNQNLHHESALNDLQTHLLMREELQNARRRRAAQETSTPR